MQRGMDFKPNADGSVMLYIQNQSPGAKEESDWLPAPKDNFILLMRLYWPKETSPTILNDSWSIPEAKKVSCAAGFRSLPAITALYVRAAWP